MSNDSGVLALVTGANGFVGCHLVEHLLGRGYRVRALVRTTSDLTALEGTAAEIVYGDVTRAETLPAALDGVEVVYHVAGLTKTRDRQAYFTVNRDGSRNLADACLGRSELRRLVYVSSQAAVGPSPPGAPRDEDVPPAPIGPYGKSKLAGEQATAEVTAGAVPLTIVRPAIVYGPWERDMLQLFRLARFGMVPRVLGDSHVSLIHAVDLADLLERAGRTPAAEGRTYFAADPRPVWMSEVIRTVAGSVGRRVLQLPVPPFVLWPVALVNELLQRLGGGVEIFTLSRLREFRERFWTVDPGRAMGDLEWRPGRTLDEGLAETGRWYREMGWV